MVKANRNYRSRFNRHLEAQSRRNIALAILGIIVIVVLLFRYGVPILIDLSLFLSGSKKQDQAIQQQESQVTYIAPPSLNSPFTATNSAQITISGTTTGKYKIALYQNDNLLDTKEAGSDGSFSFSNVSLKDGQNRFRAKALQDGKASDYSETMTITYQKSGPKLTLDSPNGDMTVKDNHFTVSGTTDPNASVTVNGHQAIIDENGKFSFPIQLPNGDTQITVVSVDDAGNKTQVTHKVTYSP